MISIISPVFNEAGNIPELVERVVRACEEANEDFEFILVENGSHDQSLDIIRRLKEKDNRIKFLRLSRNFGHQGGLLAGLHHARGEAVITIDGDLQHPPELIPDLIKQWKQGHQVVYTTKRLSDSQPGWQRFLSKCFYKAISKISEIELSYGQSDFRLLDRQVVYIICDIPEKNKFLRGIVDWVGFEQTHIEYTPPARHSGRSKFRLSHYINFALDGIFSFSIFPLRLVLLVGVVVSALCLMAAFIYFICGVLNLFGYIDFLPPGWATIAVSITFLGGVQLMGLGLVGEYISRIYLQSKQRPDFIVREKNLD